MAFDLILLGSKLRRYREQFQYSFSDMVESTGISEKRLESFEEGAQEPSGDEILILSDFYKCDYQFFVSNERIAPFEQTEALFRRFGNDFLKDDRRSVQEFLFLAESEAFLEEELNRKIQHPFKFVKRGSHFKTHGKEAADSLRAHLKYLPTAISPDLYKDIRSAGVRVYRRKLKNSNISGLFINHPFAGRCILINYSEDVYRQRFTAAHEAGHAFLDDDESFVVSLKGDGGSNREQRANAFASRFLMPPSLLSAIPLPHEWNEEKALEFAGKIRVSTEALAYALRENRLIDADTVDIIKSVRLSKSKKEDPELPASLPPGSRKRKEEILSKGLSNFYVRLCFDAYRETIISAARLGEMLLADSDYELQEFASLFGESLSYGP